MAAGKFDKMVENVMSGKSIFMESKTSAKAKYLDKLSPDKAKAEEERIMEGIKAKLTEKELNLLKRKL